MQNIRSQLLQSLKQTANLTRTENGAVTLRTSGSDVLDLFASIGALRNAEDSEILRRFHRAWCEDRSAAMKILFYARDVRGGIGERRVFRAILRRLSVQEPQALRRNLSLIPEYGRWDDLLVLLGTPCEPDVVRLISQQLEQDLEAARQNHPVSLLGKWLPSVNASHPETVRQANELARLLGMQPACYRRTLSLLREKIRILENHLRTKDYTFDYSEQPGKAMFKYRRAFLRNDTQRYTQYLDCVQRGETTMHTSVLMPYELVHSALHFQGTEQDRQALDVTWKALEDYTQNHNALAVVDGSDSMYWGRTLCPAEVALSLGIYFARHNRGAFRNHFITFSTTPQLVEIKGKDLVDQVRYCQTFGEVADTNLEAVFALILASAVEKHLPQEELPETLYIISDMEFNQCARNASLSNFENAKQMYANFGYRLPNVVFWNVNSRNLQQPVRHNEQGVALVSGCSPRIFSMVIEGKTNPYHAMMEVLSSPRYEPIDV